MDINKIKENVIEALENVGIYINTEIEIDIDLKNYIEDSIQFISMIIQFEELLQIEIPSELLLFDNFETLEKTCIILKELVDIK